ncbi:hypothetical protein NMY22_g10490 [Coprinellus aureogranulatus]|nr:hypothetical protein NMY22_g10490 [Coprinellus aureogranulatus]
MTIPSSTLNSPCAQPSAMAQPPCATPSSELKLSRYGFTDRNLDSEITLGPRILPQFATEGKKTMKPLNIISLCRHIYSLLATTANRENPFQRTQSGTLYDIYATFGRHLRGRIEIPGLRARFVFNPGSVLVVAGGLLEVGIGQAEDEMITISSHFNADFGRASFPLYEVSELPLLADFTGEFGLWRPPSDEEDIWGEDDADEEGHLGGG